MAEHYDTADPSTNKLWAKRLWSGHRSSDPLFDDRLDFTGPDPDENAIVMVDDMQRSTGDEVTITISDQIESRGVIGDDILEGKEAPIETSTFKMKIDDQVMGVRSRGIMNGQRVKFDTMEEARRKLKDQWKTRRSVTAANHLTGNTRQTDLAYTGLNSPAAPDTQHIYRIGSGLGAGTDEGVGADNTAKLDFDTLDDLVTIGESLPSRPINPFVINGSPYFGMLIHGFNMRDLRDENTQWYNVMITALQGGLRDENPLFTRAAGKWRNTLIFVSKYLPRGTHSATGAAVESTRRCVFFGAGALAMAYGRLERGTMEKFRWVSGDWDHKRKYYASAGLVWGMKCPRFNLAGTARDYGKIVVTTYTEDRVANYGDLGQVYS